MNMTTRTMTTTRSRFLHALAAAAACALVVLSAPAGGTQAQSDANQIVPPAAFKDLKWR